MDCDRQHEPESMAFIEAIERNDADVISEAGIWMASRERRPARGSSIHEPLITQELNARLISITDAFCGFKAYRSRACGPLELDADGYDFPMVLGAGRCANWDRRTSRSSDLQRPEPSFGGPLDDVEVRRRYYEATLHRELVRRSDRCRRPPWP